MSEGFYKGEAYKSSKNDSWTTPKNFFQKLDAEFNFVMDAAALSTNTLVPDNWLGPDHPTLWRRDALTCAWAGCSGGGWIFLNPPYGKEIGAFMRKANSEIEHGAKTVALVPARTNTKWWHESCIQHEVRFIKGRLKFGDGKNPAPFPSAVVIIK